MLVSGSDDTKGKETWSLSWESSQQNNDTANVIIMPSVVFFEITSKKKKMIVQFSEISLQIDNTQSPLAHENKMLTPIIFIEHLCKER